LTSPRISVVIPVLNGSDKIESCLKSVFAQSFKPYEVIVIDGQSTDSTIERAKKFPVRIFHENSHSIACGRQIGVENATGEFIAFTDVDCIADKNWLINLVKEFNENIVAVGGGINSFSGSFWEKSINLALDTFVGGAKTIQARFFKDKRLVSDISACNSMYRKKDLLNIGGFDVNLIGGGEELDLNRRLSKVGKFLYTPEALITHYHEWTLDRFVRKMFRYGRERGVVRAWSIQFVPALLAPLLVLSLIITPWVFVSVLGLYLMTILSMGLKLSIQEKNPRYQVSVPLVYLLEHIAYSLGIWIGLARTRNR